MASPEVGRHCWGGCNCDCDNDNKDEDEQGDSGERAGGGGANPGGDISGGVWRGAGGSTSAGCEAY
jgi:hypothetical protein